MTFPLSQANNIVDLTEENFQSILTEQSQDKLLLIDFWADWCEPCKTLMPILETIAQNNPDTILLAKLNCEEQQNLAAQFGVRNLPTVAFFKDGQPVDGFSGLQPEQEILAKVSEHLPKPELQLLAQAKTLILEDNAIAAFPLLNEALDLAPDNIEIKKCLSDAAIAIGKFSEAEALLGQVTMVDQDDYYRALVSRLELAKEASDSPEIQALQQAIADDPEQLGLQVQLAVQLHQVQRSEEALDILFAQLKQDLNALDGEVKKVFMEILTALPEGDSLASQYRRKLFGLLY